jgi:hypothetical protein
VEASEYGVNHLEAQMKKLTTTAVAALAAALVALAPTALAAPAKDGDGRVLQSGRCSAGTTWKLKAKADDGRIETEFEVDQNRNGRRWHVTLQRNGVVVFKGTRTTVAPSGSFEVRRLLAPTGGSVRIVATAKAVRGGETCRAALTF